MNDEPNEAQVLKLLVAPRRREILRLLWNEECSVGEIHHSLRDVTMGAVSQHLRLLRDGGLVSVRREGRRRLYRAEPTAVGSLREWLESCWASALYELKLQAELEQSRRGPRAGATDGEESQLE